MRIRKRRGGFCRCKITLNIQNCKLFKEKWHFVMLNFTKNPPFYAFFMLFNSFFFVNSRKNTTFAISLFRWKPKRVGREKDNIYIKGVSWRFEFDAIRTSQLQSVCQKQSNGNAPTGVLYAFRWLMGISCILCWCWLNIHSVGLSALLVSTNRAMRRP